MKALSIQQPWATLIVLGVKRFETRRWHTDYRGPLAIHAARTFPAKSRLLCHTPPIRDILREAGINDWLDLPVGVVIGTVELAGCTRVEELPALRGLDQALGDFAPGRWAWELRDPERWQAPIPAKGQLGVFELKPLHLNVT